MIRTVLVPTDLSDASYEGLVEGCELARRVGADLRLVHVVEEDPLFTAYGPMEGMTTDAVRFTEEACQRSKATLKEKCAAVQAETGLRVDSTVAQGPAAAEVVRLAGIAGEVMVCMTTHGRSGLTAAVLGSVAERVVRTCAGPVLISRGTTLGEPGRAICAVDLRDESLALVPQAVTYAQKLGLPLHFVYAFDDSFTSSLTRTILFPLSKPEGSQGHSEKKVREMLEVEVKKRLPDGVEVSYEVLNGHPADAIAKASEGAGLVILGTHGRSGVSRAIMGSVAERVVRTAHSSVLVLRSPEAKSS